MADHYNKLAQKFVDFDRVRSVLLVDTRSGDAPITLVERVTELAEEHGTTIDHNVDVLVTIPNTQSGPDENLMDRANRAAIDADPLGLGRWVVAHPDLWGGYAVNLSDILAYAENLDDDGLEILEVVDGLTDYPVIDDEIYSRLEMEEIGAEWESWGAHECLELQDESLSDYGEALYRLTREDEENNYTPAMGYPEHDGYSPTYRLNVTPEEARALVADLIVGD